MGDWVGHARDTLERDGYRLSAPRTAVVETLATLGCSVTAKEIADRLGISPRTVETHVGSLLNKLGVRNRAEAARRYREAHAG